MRASVIGPPYHQFFSKTRYAGIRGNTREYPVGGRFSDRLIPPKQPPILTFDRLSRPDYVPRCNVFSPQRFHAKIKCQRTPPRYPASGFAVSTGIRTCGRRSTFMGHPPAHDHRRPDSPPTTAFCQVNHEFSGIKNDPRQFPAFDIVTHGRNARRVEQFAHQDSSFNDRKTLKTAVSS
jgi:hypothetical protein